MAVPLKSVQQQSINVKADYDHHRGAIKFEKQNKFTQPFKACGFSLTGTSDSLTILEDFDEKKRLK